MNRSNSCQTSSAFTSSTSRASQQNPHERRQRHLTTLVANINQQQPSRQQHEAERERQLANAYLDEFLSSLDEIERYLEQKKAAKQPLSQTPAEEAVLIEQSRRAPAR